MKNKNGFVEFSHAMESISETSWRLIEYLGGGVYGRLHRVLEMSDGNDGSDNRIPEYWSVGRKIPKMKNFDLPEISERRAVCERQMEFKD